MIFSRKATIEDFHNENIRWDEILIPKVRQLIHSGRKGQAVLIYKHHNSCGVQEARRIIDSYIGFKEAWDDFTNNKDVYVQYK